MLKMLKMLLISVHEKCVLYLHMHTFNTSLCNKTKIKYIFTLFPTIYELYYNLKQVQP